MRLSEVQAFNNLKNAQRIGEIVPLLEPDLFFKVPSALLVSTSFTNKDDAKIEDIVTECFVQGIIVDASGQNIDLEGRSAFEFITAPQANEIVNALMPLLFPKAEKKT